MVRNEAIARLRSPLVLEGGKIYFYVDTSSAQFADNINAIAPLTPLLNLINRTSDRQPDNYGAENFYQRYFGNFTQKVNAYNTVQ